MENAVAVDTRDRPILASRGILGARAFLEHSLLYTVPAKMISYFAVFSCKCPTLTMCHGITDCPTKLTLMDYTDQK